MTEAEINAKAYAAVAEQWSAEEIEHCGVSIRDVVAIAVEASGALSLAEENARLREALKKVEWECSAYVATLHVAETARAALNDPHAAGGSDGSTTEKKAE